MKKMKLVSLAIWTVTVFVAHPLAAQAETGGPFPVPPAEPFPWEGDCFHNADCADSKICTNGACVEPDGTPKACTEDSGCLDGEACMNGFCKLDGVKCETSLGFCAQADPRADCCCHSEYGDVCVGGNVYVDPTALHETCGENLMDFCDYSEAGTKCMPHKVEPCEAYYAKVEALLHACGDEDVRPLDFRRFTKCCGENSDPDQEIRSCVMGLAESECDKIDACWPEEESCGCGDDDKLGCRVGGQPNAVIPLLALALWAWPLARRRRVAR